MALSTTVSKRIKRKAPRPFLKRTFKQKKPHLRLETDCDLLIHLNCLLFVHRLAEESRVNACEGKSRVIKQDHILAAAKIMNLFGGEEHKKPKTSFEINSFDTFIVIGPVSNSEEEQRIVAATVCMCVVDMHLCMHMSVDSLALLKEEFGVVSSLLVEVVATTGGPYGEKLGEELDENSELFAVGNLKIKDSTLQRFLRECDQVAPWFAVSGSLTVSSWEKLGRDLDFAAEQGTLRPGVKPVWRLVRGCLEDQHCSSALECGQAALEQLQEELSEKAESEKTAPQKAPKDRGKKGNTEQLYPSLSDIEDSDGESTDSAISEMDSLIQGMHRARIRDKPKALSKSEGACRYTPPTAPPLYSEMPRGTSNHPDLWREVQRELSVVCPVFVDDRNQRYHEPLDFKNIKSIAESVRTYGVTAAFTITQGRKDPIWVPERLVRKVQPQLPDDEVDITAAAAAATPSPAESHGATLGDSVCIPEADADIA
ncbi:hypothetical protein STEG23_022055 [Scotinomys teguina]